jgi:hypothetical protein
MTQLEKDRLIEKFMGWELEWIENKPAMYKGWVFVNDESGGSIGGMYNTSTVGFTTDWNWLMRALKKFDTIDNPELPTKYCELCDNIDYAVTLYNIDDAVNALCEGIEWYNSTINE